MEINYISPDFPIYLIHVQTYVTLYSFGTGSDVLLGQDFLKRFIPVTFGKDTVTSTTNEGLVMIPTKNEYQLKVKPGEEDNLQETMHNLTKIQKIVKHADIHGQKPLQAISDKLHGDCTASRPGAF